MLCLGLGCYPGKSYEEGYFFCRDGMEEFSAAAAETALS